MTHDVLSKSSYRVHWPIRHLGACGDSVPGFAIVCTLLALSAFVRAQQPEAPPQIAFRAERPRFEDPSFNQGACIGRLHHDEAGCGPGWRACESRSFCAVFARGWGAGHPEDQSLYRIRLQETVCDLCLLRVVDPADPCVVGTPRRPKKANTKK